MQWHKKQSMVARISLIAMSTAMALLIAEAALRGVYSRVPSLAGVPHSDHAEYKDVRRWTEPPPTLKECGLASTHQPRPLRTTRHGEGRLQRLWVVGDSLVHSWGVDWSASWPAGVADQLAIDIKSQVLLSRIGGSGNGYCRNVAALNHLLDRKQPDVMVFQIFADDLERRTAVMVGDKVVAVPTHPLSRHSYLANLLWFSWRTRLGGALPDRDADAAGMARFRRVLKDLDQRLDTLGVPWIAVLIAPAGLPRCDASQGSWSDCEWLRGDLDRMAHQLEQLSIDWLDLREQWSTHSPGTLPDEEKAWRERGRLPVHPSAAGHQVISAAVSAALSERVQSQVP